MLAFQLQKAQSNYTQIKNPEPNRLETEPREISDAFAKYYKELYKSQEQELKKEKIVF